MRRVTYGHMDPQAKRLYNFNVFFMRGSSSVLAVLVNIHNSAGYIDHQPPKFTSLFIQAFLTSGLLLDNSIWMVLSYIGWPAYHECNPDVCLVCPKYKQTSTSIVINYDFRIKFMWLNRLQAYIQSVKILINHRTF